MPGYKQYRNYTMKLYNQPLLVQPRTLSNRGDHKSLILVLCPILVTASSSDWLTPESLPRLTLIAQWPSAATKHDVIPQDDSEESLLWCPSF